MRVVRDELRPLHVLVVRRARAVVHHRGVSPGERVCRLLHGRAVVEVKRDGNLRAEREALERPREIIRLPRVEEAHVELDDDRLVLRLGGLEDRSRSFVVCDVERADGLLRPSGLAKHLLHVDKRHICPSRAFRRQTHSRHREFADILSNAARYVLGRH